MAEAYKTRTTRRQTGTRTVHKNKGLFNPEKVEQEEPVYEYIEEDVPTGQISDCEIDSIRFGQDIEDACNQLHDQGYNVLSITPVVRGAHQHQYSTGKQTKGTGPGAFGFGYGFSLTDSVVILGRKRTME